MLTLYVWVVVCFVLQMDAFFVCFFLNLTIISSIWSHSLQDSSNIWTTRLKADLRFWKLMFEKLQRSSECNEQRWWWRRRRGGRGCGDTTVPFWGPAALWEWEGGNKKQAYECWEEAAQRDGSRRRRSRSRMLVRCSHDGASGVVEILQQRTSPLLSDVHLILQILKKTKTGIWRKNEERERIWIIGSFLFLIFLLEIFFAPIVHKKYPNNGCHSWNVSKFV